MLRNVNRLHRPSNTPPEKHPGLLASGGGHVLARRGAATLVGDPPNIIVASRRGLRVDSRGHIRVRRNRFAVDSDGERRAGAIDPPASTTDLVTCIGPAHWPMETAAAFHPITYVVESMRSLILKDRSGAARIASAGGPWRPGFGRAGLLSAHRQDRRGPRRPHDVLPSEAVMSGCSCARPSPAPTGL